MIKSRGYAAYAADENLKPFDFERREIGATDIHIEIKFCGVCHSDLHTARNEWKGTTYPVVPGHEIVGEVLRVGADVKGFKAGDIAAVGCMVDSCGKCLSCKEGLEQYCENEIVFTYNSLDVHTGLRTYGGYSNNIVVDERFVLHLSSKLDIAASAPLLCAGITTYSPLRHWKVKKGDKVAIVGMGGLGHMGVKLAAAMGAEVVVFSRSKNKEKDALRFGASQVVAGADSPEAKKYANSFDFILNTVAASHNLDAYLLMLKQDATMCLVGAPENPHPSPNVWPLIMRRRKIGGSLIGGIAETQEMLDFCAEHGIVSDIELIPIQKINEAYERMLKSDVRYRFVIDMSQL